MISNDDKKYRFLYLHLRSKLDQDLQNYINRNKDDPQPQPESKGFKMIIIIRLYGFLAPLCAKF